MRNLLLILVLLLTSNIYANKVDTVKTKSKITDVTVFLDGAQITREVNISIPKGKHLLLIDNLPAEVNAESIQVSAIKNCETHSVKHSLKYPLSRNANIIAHEKAEKKEKIKILETRNKINVLEIEERILLENSRLSNKNDGSKIEDIKQAAIFYRAKLNEIRTQKILYTLEIDEIEDRIKELRLEINKIESKTSKIYSNISVVVESKVYVKGRFTVSYFVTSAGWSPLYDFRVMDINSPLNLVYNANIYQSTGEDWNNVSLTLSTNSPSISNEKPVLDTWYINRHKVKTKTKEKKYFGSGALQGKVFDADTKEPIPFANVTVEKDGKMIGGGTTDIDGNYKIKPLPAGKYTVKVRYIGYSKQDMRGVIINNDKIRYLNIKLKSSTMEMEAVVVNYYQEPLIDIDQTSTGGTMTAKEISKMPGRSAESVAVTVGGVYSNRYNRYDNQQYTAPKKSYKPILISGNDAGDNITSLEYKIAIPYTIPSNGQEYIVKIKEIQKPVNYVYSAIPKLDRETFLTAEIIDWADLNLLSASASVYYKGTYTGKTFIDAESIKDTLIVSLSREKNVIVERKLLEDRNKKSYSGRKITQTINWNITIRNNRPNSIKILVEDQIPISEVDDFDVETIELSGGTLNPKTGKVIWEIEIPANQKKELDLIYSIKYPNYRKIIIE